MRIACLLLLLALPARAQFSAQELKDRKTFLMEVNQAAATADAQLPPCEGHDRLSEAALRKAPPASCPKAKAFYDTLTKGDLALRNNCRDMTRWMEGELRDPELCASPKQNRVAQDLARLVNYKKEMNRALGMVGNELADDEEPFAEKGEFARMECSLPVMVGMQLRKKQLTLANKNFSQADYALDENCRNPKAKNSYLDFLRDGEAGLDGTSP